MWWFPSNSKAEQGLAWHSTEIRSVSMEMNQNMLAVCLTHNTTTVSCPSFSHIQNFNNPVCSSCIQMIGKKNKNGLLGITTWKKNIKWLVLQNIMNLPLQQIGLYTFLEIQTQVILIHIGWHFVMQGHKKRVVFSITMHITSNLLNTFSYFLDLLFLEQKKRVWILKLGRLKVNVIVWYPSLFS